ncbi:response regulator [Acaryochloris sp. CCMEE 5410]|uniref:response regulator n=1 Tax=Acaryochloris sp. CCMEE 5410 TaxID=310037 RepID=UPI0002484DF9|nr:response regulator [Acaryochloris sp. CCMEE 5410]KAI9131982.1 response regulator [Acaryochloris sp. CCMEE 5410]
MESSSLIHSQNIVTPSGEHTQRNRRPLVLVIEDDQDNLLLLYHLVTSLGCDVLLAREGQAGLAMVKDTLPDLILLDIVMPHLSGFDILRRLKQLPQARSVAVVAVTGLATSEEKQKLLEAGCCDYVCKPYLIDVLESLICKYASIQSPPQFTKPTRLPASA